MAFCSPFAWAQPPAVGGCTILPADNIWNTPVDQLPAAPSSATYITTIGSAKSVHADFGSGVYAGGPIGIPFVLVTGSQAKYPASFTYASESDPGPYAVPLNAPIEGGSSSTGDRHAIAVDTTNCVLYELYNSFPQAASWKADSGAIYNLLSNALRPATWTSADAAGLPIFPGLIRYDEVLAGEIRHAIRFTVPQTLKAYVWPARHHASSLTDPKYPPMGARFRLRADFNISAYSAANQVILKAMKKYGLILADNGSAWYISGAPDSLWNNDDLHKLGQITGAAFEAVDVSSLMIDPNSGQAVQSGVSVSVSPASASVLENASRQFTATVHNSTNTSVTWSVNGAVGGNSSVGWIDPNGLYLAPNVLPSPATVTVKAVSAAAPLASGAASVTITAPAPPAVTVAVSPTSATVLINTTKQFAATVQNASNAAVTWKVNGVTGGNSTVGRISATGLYTAPSRVPSSQVTVRAVSVADPQVSAAASITVKRR